MKKILIVAGDPSGDLHGATLVRRLKAMSSDIDIAAIGGPELKKAGANVIADLVSEAVVGFSEVVAHLPSVLKIYATACSAARRADLVVFIDYPGFNLALAKKISRLDRRPKMLYYIAPQVWAWHKSRAAVMSQIMDRIAVVFPFEESAFPAAEQGSAERARVEFVGHPLLDIPDPIPDPEFAGSRVVALLPGSRKNEISRHFPIMSQTAERLSERGYRPVMSMANSGFVTRFHGAKCELYSGSARVLLASAEKAVVKSGTGTMEAALIGVPFVAVYRLSWLSYLIGRMLVDARRIAMPNILLDADIVPELIQARATPDRIVEALEKIDAAKMKIELAKIRHLLGGKGSASRVAEICLELL